MRHASRSCPREGAAGPRRLGRTAALLLLVAVFIQAATGNDVAAASLHGVSGQPLEPALSAVLRQARPTPLTKAEPALVLASIPSRWHGM